MAVMTAVTVGTVIVAVTDSDYAACTVADIVKGDALAVTLIDCVAVAKSNTLVMIASVEASTS